MTVQEAAKEIESQSLRGIWQYATSKVRLAFIEGIISAITNEPEQAAKKLTKVRKVRKAKTKTDYPAMSQYAGLEASE